MHNKIKLWKTYFKNYTNKIATISEWSCKINQPNKNLYNLKSEVFLPLPLTQLTKVQFQQRTAWTQAAAHESFKSLQVFHISIAVETQDWELKIFIKHKFITR